MQIKPIHIILCIVFGTLTALLYFSCLEAPDLPYNTGVFSTFSSTVEDTNSIDTHINTTVDTSKTYVLANEDKIDYEQNDVRSFYVVDFENIATATSSMPYLVVNCRLARKTEYGYFWIEQLYENSTNLDFLVSIAEQFDDSIYLPISESFAEPSDLDENGKIHLVFTSFGDAGSGVAGYFDRTQLTGYPESIQGEVIFINFSGVSHLFQSNMLTRTCGTISHEFQHLCYFNQNSIIENENNPLEAHTMSAVVSLESDADKWINEGMSMMAEFIYQGGYGSCLTPYWQNYDLDKEITDSFGGSLPVNQIRNGYPLLPFWDGNHDYVLSTLFFLYMYFQVDSNTLFWDILHHKDESTDTVVEFAQTAGIISEDEGWKELLGTWLLAMYRMETTGIYGYKNEIDNTWWHDSWFRTGYQGPYATELREDGDIYPGGALYFATRLDSPFEVTPPENIAYLGYTKSSQTIDMDPTGGIVGDILLVYNYNTQALDGAQTAPLPTNDILRRTTSEELSRYCTDHNSDGLSENRDPLVLPNSYLFPLHYPSYLDK